MGRMKQFYWEPEKIMPERWIGDDGMKYDPFTFPVFQAGPRICLGKDLALLEAKLCTIELLLRYQVELGERPPEYLYRPGLTISYNADLALYFKAR